MGEAKASTVEEGGDTWSILAGQYDPVSNPVIQEGLESALLETTRKYGHYPETALERMVDAETLLYAAGLCNPELLNNEEARIKLHADFGLGAMLIFRDGFSALQTKVRDGLDRLGNPVSPLTDAINDMLKKELINGYKADQLKTITGVAIIKEIDGDLLSLRGTR